MPIIEEYFRTKIQKKLDLLLHLHSGLGRIAGILSLEVEDPNVDSTSLQRVGSELAMHVVAAKPLFLSKEFVSSDALENEREILRSQVQYYCSGLPLVHNWLFIKI